jgi:hypothetical protein
MKLSERYSHLIENFDKLPDDAVIPTAVTAALLCVNPKTVVSHYESVQISPGRTGPGIPRSEYKAPNVRIGSNSVIAVMSAARPLFPKKRHLAGRLERPFRSRT